MNQVPIPAGLDLDAWINQPPKTEERGQTSDNVNDIFSEWEAEQKKQFSTLDPEEMKRVSLILLFKLILTLTFILTFIDSLSRARSQSLVLTFSFVLIYSHLRCGLICLC
jgi:hypothetical protein